MILKDNQFAELLENAKPLMKWLSENFHPHVKVIVDYSKIEILESSAMDMTDEFVKD